MTNEVVIVYAEDAAGLVREIDRIVGYLDRVGDASLVSVAYTASEHRGPARLAVVVDSVVALRSRLVSARDRIAGGARRLRDKSGTYYFAEPLLGPGRGKLAFVYPGVMSFYPDMMRDLAILCSACREAFDELEEALKGDVDFTPSSFVFPPAACYRHDADIFSSGAYAQALVATYSACIAMTRMLSVSGIAPDGIVGFAGGDLAAMVASGAAGEKVPRPDRVRMIADIYRIVNQAVDHAGLPKTAMVAVLLRRDEDGEAALKRTLAAFPAGKVTLAIDLSPRQKTYAVEPGFAAEALAAFSAAGIRAMVLELDRPFNTPASESLVPAVTRFANTWMKRSPAIEVYSCASAAPVSSSLRAARRDTADRWSRPVRFADTIRRMYADGYRVFLEAGPRSLMTSAVEDTLKGEEHAAIAMNSIHRRGLLQAEHAVAQLAALGADMDLGWIYRAENAQRLDFDSAMAAEGRRESEMLLSRRFPRLTLIAGDDAALKEVTAFAEPRGRGAKAAARAAAIAAQTRRQRQFDYGAIMPLVADADEIEHVPGVAVEFRKTFKLSEAPFVADFAIGVSQLSYTDPNLRGLVLLTIPVAAEIMAEAAAKLAPGLVLVAIEDLASRRNVAFVKGELTLFVKAERIAAASPEQVAVKVLLREDAPDAAYTRPVMEGVFVMAKTCPKPPPTLVEPLAMPRSVHWSGRDVYPQRLCMGRRLRGIVFAENWSEGGLDYEVEVPTLADNVVYTRFPVWLVNPVLLGAVVSGFQLWRSNDRVPGAYSFPFRLRRLELHGSPPAEGARLKCYLRLMDVTPRTQISDIHVSDGDGLAVMTLSGWEEIGSHVNAEYRDLVMQPAVNFVTSAFSPEFLGNPGAEVASAYVTDIPYSIFERDEELWLKVFSHIVLGSRERGDFFTKPGSAARRTEWLFGRIAAKEAVRRFLKERYQARWSYADVTIYANDLGKPYALGEWQEHLRSRLDVAIAHTSQFIVALAAANARVGVDVESAARDLSEEFTAGVFTPEELEIAARAASSSQAVIRFWCAKEAVSKALGTGIRYSPRELNVSGYDADTGKVSVRLAGAWAEAFRQFKGRELPVTVRNLREHALAFCFLPAAMFED